MPIFDQGYQHWNGQLSGHAWRWLAVTRHGFRAGLKSRMVRYVLFAAWVPALALVLMLCFWGLMERGSSLATTFMQFMRSIQPELADKPKDYRVDIWRLSYNAFLYFELLFSMILVLLIGPGLISQDLRFNTLPLYFSRPLRRIDYFLGKLGVVVLFLSLVTIVPSLVAYVLGLAFSLDLSIIGDTFPILLGALAYGLIISLSAGCLVLALSCLSRNSRYVTLMWLGIWFVSGVVSTMLVGVNAEQRRYSYYEQIEVPRPGRFEGQTRQQRMDDFAAWRAAREVAREKYRIAELNFGQTDWRPLVSYDQNLRRLGHALLRTDQTWDRLSLLWPDQNTRDEMLMRFRGPQYPWYWSAIVLAGLFGLSACILNFSIRSLDRLK